MKSISIAMVSIIGGLFMLHAVLLVTSSPGPLEGVAAVRAEDRLESDHLLKALLGVERDCNQCGMECATGLQACMTACAQNPPDPSCTPECCRCSCCAHKQCNTTAPTNPPCSCPP